MPPRSAHRRGVVSSALLVPACTQHRALTLALTTSKLLLHLPIRHTSLTNLTPLAAPADLRLGPELGLALLDGFILALARGFALLLLCTSVENRGGSAMDEMEGEGQGMRLTGAATLAWTGELIRHNASPDCVRREYSDEQLQQQ